MHMLFSHLYFGHPTVSPFHLLLSITHYINVSHQIILYVSLPLSFQFLFHLLTMNNSLFRMGGFESAWFVPSLHQQLRWLGFVADALHFILCGGGEY
ncbi:hypothetical protein HN51_046625 [Arachis hypogaea]